MSGYAYEDLREGLELGVVAGRITGDELAAWERIHAQTPNGSWVPASYVMTLSLQALMCLDVIPPGGVLAVHELGSTRRLRLGEPFDTGLRVGRLWSRNDRTFAELLADVRDDRGEVVLTDSMTVLWPGGDVVPQTRLGPVGSDGDMAVTQQAVRDYADLSGDRNPLHLDPSYAAQGPFGELVVHGVIPAVHLLHRMGGAFTDTDAGGVTVKFVSPLRPGESFDVRGPAGGTDETWTCATGDGRVVCVARPRSTTKEVVDGDA